jgi:integrase
MPTPNAPPKRLRAQLTDPLSGKRRSVYADTGEALAHRVKRIRDVRDDLQAGVITRDVAHQQIRPYVAGPLTIGDAFKRYVLTIPEASRRLARANWEARLKKWFETVAPEVLNRELMSRWEYSLIERGDAPKTIRNTYDHLAGCCRMLIDTGELKELPWGNLSKFQGGTGWRPQKSLPRKHRQAAATIQQVQALIEVAKASDMTRWERGLYSDRSLIMGFLLLTGCRQGEAAGLAWDSVTIDGEVPILRVQYQAKRGWDKAHPDWTRPRDPTKTKRELAQHLHPTVVAILRAQRAELLRRGWYRLDGPVFPGKLGAWRTHGQVLKPEIIRDFAKRAGFPHWEDWVTHSTRHSFSTLEVIAAGGDLRRAQLRTGHADLKSLEGYLHAAGAFLGESGIPAIPVEVTPVVARLGPDLDVVAADPWGIEQVPGAPSVTEVNYDANRRWAEKRAEERAAERARADVSFAELARSWLTTTRVDKGRRELPTEVALKCKQSASRNYQATLRASGDKEKARRSAVRGRIAVKAAWSKALKNARQNAKLAAE